MFALYRTFPEVASASRSGTAVPAVARPNGPADGGSVRPGLLGVVADALDSARRDRGD